jgi:Fis family transcriptional regulator
MRDLKVQLETIILQMRADGISYSEAIREFQKTFIFVVLRELKGNQYKAAQKLRIHRNTLRRTMKEFQLDIRSLRPRISRPSE